MSIQQHKDYHYEKARLKYTNKLIEHVINTIINERVKNKENIKQAMIDLDFLDSSQSYITILTSNELLKIGAQNYSGLTRARNKPYFGRIDFREDNQGESVRYYIGKVALAKRKDNSPVIIDWRSPLANMYYDGRLGEVSYESPAGTINGELSLKRQYTIAQGHLEDYIDIDITTTDAFLQASLQVHADTRLKDIASTIQSEQNKVIRADAARPLIVQGVAGSGKTTIALHRIAYLLYTYGDTLVPENFLILAPNRLFINYISEVLPELGVERIRQSTFADFILELIGGTHRLTNTNEKIHRLLEGGMDSAESEMLKRVAAYKGSLEFKDLLDNYIRALEQQLLPEEDFMLEEYVIYEKEDTKALFIIEYSFLPLYRRFESIQNVLANKLKNSKESIVKELEDSYEKQIERARKTITDEEERRTAVVRLMDERESKVGRIKRATKALVVKYLGKPKQNLLGYYKEIVCNSETLMKYSNKPLDAEFAAYFCQHSAKVLAKKCLEYEDLAALAYLEHNIFGAGEKPAIQHVVIDEAQDFSLFQFYTLKHVLNTKLFTILGDLSQGIHAYRALSDWQQVMQMIFDQDDCQFLTLEQSYRTTIEIMSLANEVIKTVGEKQGLTLARPVIRHGLKPQVLKTKKDSDIIDMIKKAVEQGENLGHKSFAVICKNTEECETVHRQLKKAGVEATQLTGEESVYTAGVVVLPSYAAKGLEFDVVFIVNKKARYTTEIIDTKLLYVAMTRALHLLYVGYVDGTIPLLDDVDRSLFDEYVP